MVHLLEWECAEELALLNHFSKKNLPSILSSVARFGHFLKDFGEIFS